MICQYGSTSGAYFACPLGHSESGGACLAGPGTEKGFLSSQTPEFSPATLVTVIVTIFSLSYALHMSAASGCSLVYFSSPGILMNDSVICQLLARRHRCSASCITVTAAMAITPAASPACVAPRLLPCTSVVRSLQICRCHHLITRRRLQIGRLCSASAQSK